MCDSRTHARHSLDHAVSALFTVVSCRAGSESARSARLGRSIECISCAAVAPAAVAQRFFLHTCKRVSFNAINSFPYCYCYYDHHRNALLDSYRVHPQRVGCRRRSSGEAVTASAPLLLPLAAFSTHRHADYRTVSSQCSAHGDGTTIINHIQLAALVVVVVNTKHLVSCAPPNRMVAAVCAACSSVSRVAAAAAAAALQQYNINKCSVEQRRAERASKSRVICCSAACWSRRELLRPSRLNSQTPISSTAGDREHASTHATDLRSDTRKPSDSRTIRVSAELLSELHEL